ncbi:versican core protein-like protein [Aphelenchoides avenae]|nr:versican core protein-like protein [Aphelenchus avenae]
MLDRLGDLEITEGLGNLETPANPETANGCPTGWSYFPYTNKCYRIFNTGNPTNWDQYRKVCVDNGGRAVSIHSEQENQFIVDLAKNLPQLYPGSKNAVWIGLRQAGRNPTPFLWDDGSPLNYRKFDKGQASNLFTNPKESYNEHCGFIQIEHTMTHPYTWDDAGCRNRKRQPYGVCQIVLGARGRKG